MKIADLNLNYSKGKPPKNLIGPALYPYLTPEYLRGKVEPDLIPQQPGSVTTSTNEIILLWDGSNAGEFFRAKEGILSSTMVKFDKSKRINSEYLFYALKHSEYELKSKTAGSGIPHVDKDVLLNLDIEVPTPKEQQKIAQILTKADDAIQQTERLIAKYEAIRTGLMQDLLTRGIDEAGNIRSEETHAFKDSELGRIPVEWEVIKLSSGIKSIADYRGKTPPYEKSGIPALSAENIGAGKVKSITKYVSEGTYKRWLTRAVPKSGDLIFTMEAPVGEIAIFPSYKALLTRRVIAFNFDETKLNSKFVYLKFSKIKSEKYWEAKSHGSTVPRLLKPQVTELLVAMPENLTEQEEIIGRIEAVEKTLSIRNEELLKIKALKTALMQDLLTGNKRVDNLMA
jgi:type I restriction enzyme S subunit